MKKIILSLLTAFAMVFGILVAPFTTAKAADVVESGKDGAANAATQTTDVVIHKMKLDSLAGWPKTHNDVGADNKTKYDGTKLDASAYFGDKAEELEGVTFYYYEVTDKESYEKMKNDTASYKTKAQVDAKIQDKTIKATYKNSVTTTKNGADVKGLANGYYWFVEDTNTVKDPKNPGSTWSGAAAVPFGLSLPYANKDGKPFTTGDNALHVYPKNLLAKEPQVDKDFKGKENPEGPRAKAEKDKPEEHDKNDIVEYEIKTVFQPNTNYSNVYWSDQMTENLEFDKNSVELRAGDVKLDAADYVLTLKGSQNSLGHTVKNTFEIRLTDSGLKKINGKADKVTITVSYTAKLLDGAKEDIPESNDVTFHYGNNPSEGNTPVPTKPANKKIKVTKTFATDATKKEIIVQLVNANTGAVVEDNVALNEANKWTKEWDSLDEKYSYKVVEKTTGYDVIYDSPSAGQISIENKKSENPEPKNPDEPKVVTRGKKFVKMEQGSNTVRLKGAKFVIKNAEGKFLTSTANEATTEKSAYEKSQKEYENAVKAYNEAVAENKKENELAPLRTTLEQNRVARDRDFTAYVKALNKWKDGTGTDKKTPPTDAVVLESDKDGKFEIKGLAAGNYTLVETEKPAGYAALTAEVPFEVKEGSYAGDKATEIKYVPAEDDSKGNAENGYGQRVDNKKVTIPQTGGIGSLIFIVAGLAIMGMAFVAYKKSEARA